MWAHEPAFYSWLKGNMPEKGRRPPLNATTVWEIDQHGEQSENHPTQKPLEIFTRPLEYHTRAGEITLEPFSGSGSQIIAAQVLTRRCLAMDLSAAYVDVAVRRWEKAAGKAVVLDGTELTFDDVEVARKEDGDGGEN